MNNFRNEHLRNNKFHSQDVRNFRNNLTTLSKPIIIGYMSVDVARHYHSDLSELKFLNSVSNGPTSMDLNHNINAAVKRTTHDQQERIDLLLRFLTDKHQYLFPQYNVDFITYRRTLINVMCSAFQVFEPVTIRATLFKGSIYLCYIESAQEIYRRETRSKDEDKCCAWGYKFEQYLLSDGPKLDPDIQKPVEENAEFSLYYCAELGDLKLLIGAQIDGLLTECSTLEKPRTEDFETNLNYLRSCSYAELKTNRELQTFRHERSFKRHKLLTCWCQCYLANLKGSYVGFRNDQGIVERLQWFSTQDIVAYCKNEWHPQRALNFLHHFLGYVKHSFEPHQNQSDPITFQFQINIDKTIDGDVCTDSLLPTWYCQA